MIGLVLAQAGAPESLANQWFDNYWVVLLIKVGFTMGQVSGIVGRLDKRMEPSRATSADKPSAA